MTPAARGGACAAPAARWVAAAASLPAGDPPEHVFQTRAWLRAWERSTVERARGVRYLRLSGDGAPMAFYDVEASPFWDAYEVEAGVEPVWPGPVLYAPSVYASYGPRIADPDAVCEVVDAGRAEAARRGAGAVLFTNVEAGEARRWSALRRPSAALLLDQAHRCRVAASVDEQLAGLRGPVRREFRRQWRRAHERGVTLLDLRGAAMRAWLPAFARLASATSARHSGDMYDLATFEALSDVPGARLLAAVAADRLVGAFLCFGHRGRLYLWTAGLDDDAMRELGTYAFLMYESVALAVREGFDVLEAGRGNARFKERHGFHSAELWTLVYLGERWAADDGLRRRLQAMRRGLAQHLGLA